MQYKTFTMNPWLSKTNKPWNDLRLNSSWSIGSVSFLIQQDNFASSNEWSRHYFESGEERIELIKKLDKEIQVILLDPMSSQEDIAKVPYKYRQINYNYGRTKKELDLRAAMLYGHLCSQRGFKDLTMMTCVNLVAYRVIVETYNGIVIREQNTLQTLRKEINANFKHSDKTLDLKYGVDYCLFVDDVLVAGLQIKPLSYKSKNKDYIKDAMKLNSKKEKDFNKIYKAPLYYIFSDYDGTIYNKEVIEEINSYLESFKNNIKLKII